MKRQHAHPMTQLPSNVRYGRIYHAAPARHDPGYDQPGPIRRGELSWTLIIQGVVMAGAIFLFCLLASLTAVGQ